MIALAGLSRWLLGGGWKVAGVLLLAIAFGLGVARIRHWQNEAARVPLLGAELAAGEKRAAAILMKLGEAEQKRGAAEAALSAWQSYRSVTLEPVKESGRHAPASTNPHCLPSAADRRLRNDAIRRLLGHVAAGGESGVPATARAPQ